MSSSDFMNGNPQSKGGWMDAIGFFFILAGICVPGKLWQQTTAQLIITISMFFGFIVIGVGLIWFSNWLEDSHN